MSRTLKARAQRLAPWRPFRNAAREALFEFVRRIFATGDGRSIAAEALDGLLRVGPTFVPHDPMKTHRVYQELGAPSIVNDPALRSDPIIITARFRSGSTLLWNIFRQIDGCTSYYEPFNERRWFDASHRGSHTDSTHIGVSDYWQEYEGLDHLGAYYTEDWIQKHLYMDSSAWDPAMKRYVTILIAAAAGQPVLQFNHIDFRLPWFRAHFRNAKFVHLYRNPRDSWCSSLVDPRQYSKDAPMSAFGAHDHFYLLWWARDLRHHFPFIDEKAATHPYQLFYYIWKLSYLFGVHYTHYSLAFEHLIRNPEREVKALMDALGVRQYDLGRLVECVSDQRLGKWGDYAGDEWFSSHESTCEAVLREYFGTALPLGSSRVSRPSAIEPSDRVLRSL